MTFVPRHNDRRKETVTENELRARSPETRIGYEAIVQFKR